MRPTAFFKQGATGSGASSSDPAGWPSAFLPQAPARSVLALRADDTFRAKGFDITTAGLSIVGGYRECAPGRWVRDPEARSTLLGTSPYRPLLTIDHAERVSLTALDLRASTPLVEATDATAVRLSRLRGFLPAVRRLDFFRFAVVHCTRCPDAIVDRVVLGASADAIPLRAAVVWLEKSSGRITGTRVDPGATPTHLQEFAMVRVDNPSGPIEVSDSLMSAIAGVDVRGIVVDASGPGSTPPVTVRRNTVFWSPSGSSPSDPTSESFTGIWLRDLVGARVADNVIDGSQITTARRGRATGIHDEVSAGSSITDNDIRLSSAGTGEQFGINVEFGFLGPLLIERNRVTGGASALTEGIRVDASNTWDTSATVRDNTIDVVGWQTFGLEVFGAVSREVEVARNQIRVNGGCRPFARVIGASLDVAELRFEHNRVAVTGGVERLNAASLSWASKGAVLASNHLLLGPGCGAPASALWLWPGKYQLLGNTIDAAGETSGLTPTRAVTCAPFPNAGAEVTSTGNLFGAGHGADHLVLSDPDGWCSSPAAWKSNYFWSASASGQPTTGDAVLAIVQADAGTRDPNNNLYNFNVSCLADAGTYRLAPNSPCVDTGQLLFSNDGGLIELDLEGQSRLDAGLPDVGAYELH